MFSAMQSPLISAFSTIRLARYIRAFSGDVATALDCHHWNTRISHALFFPLQTLEILFRNKMNDKIAAHYGPQWLIEYPTWLSDLPSKQNRQRKEILEVTEKLKSHKEPICHDKILSELKFAFWVCLLSSRYTETLWTPYLRHCFPNYPSGDREDLYNNISNIRDIRNRIAHHEPIVFELNTWQVKSQDELEKMYSQILEVTSWICKDTAEFVVKRAIVKETISDFIAFLKSWYGEVRYDVVRGTVKFYNKREGYGYVIVQDRKDIRIEKHLVECSGMGGIVCGDAVELTVVLGFRHPPNITNIRRI